MNKHPSSPPPPPVACEPYVALEVFLIPFSKDEQASFVVCGLFPRILSMQNGYVLFHVDYYSICGGTCITLGESLMSYTLGGHQIL